MRILRHLDATFGAVAVVGNEGKIVGSLSFFVWNDGRRSMRSF
jgi:hypothetical protein